MADTLKNISRERIATELMKAICSKSPTKLNPLLETGALEFCGLKKGILSDNISELPIDRNIRFYKMSSDLNSDAVYICEQLKTDKKLPTLCKEIHSIINTPPKNMLDCKLILKDYSLDALKACLILNGKDDKLANDTIDSGEPFLLSHLCVNGEDLIKLGISGKFIGKTLDDLLVHVIYNPKDNNKENLIKYISNN
jgi:hypothetical protein